MSEINKFRVNGWDTDSDSIEFYFRVKDANGHVLCSIVVADDGVYYYRKKSKILTPDENEHSRDTSDGFICMDDLRELFEVLRKAKLHDCDEPKRLKFKKDGKTVIVEENN